MSARIALISVGNIGSRCGKDSWREDAPICEPSGGEYQKGLCTAIP